MRVSLNAAQRLTLEMKLDKSDSSVPLLTQIHEMKSVNLNLMLKMKLLKVDPEFDLKNDQVLTVG